MCDVAIALPGGDGTRSEVACAVALNRPDALVGSEWAERLVRRPDGAVQVTGDLLKDALGYLSEADHVGDDDFEHHIKDERSSSRAPVAFESATQKPQPAYRYFDPQPGDALGAVIAWAATVHAPEAGPPREFPELKGRELLSKRYATWLAQEIRTSSPSIGRPGGCGTPADAPEA